MGMNFLTGDEKLYKKLGSKDTILLSEHDYSKLRLVSWKKYYNLKQTYPSRFTFWL